VSQGNSGCKQVARQETAGFQRRHVGDPCRVSVTRFLDGATTRPRTTRDAHGAHTLHVAAVTIPAPPVVAQVIGCGLLAVALWLVGA
jgi:hypothetical protein